MITKEQRLEILTKLEKVFRTEESVFTFTENHLPFYCDDNYNPNSIGICDVLEVYQYPEKVYGIVKDENMPLINYYKERHALLMDLYIERKHFDKHLPQFACYWFTSREDRYSAIVKSLELCKASLKID